MRGAGFAYSFLGMRKLVYILFVSMLYFRDVSGKAALTINLMLLTVFWAIIPTLL